MKKIILSLISIALFGFAHAQGQNENNDLKIIIKKTIVQNGDTLVEEKVLEGAEALAYQKRKEHMTEMRMEKSGKMNMRKHHKDHPRLHEKDGGQNVEKIIIYRNGDNSGTEEVIEHKVSSGNKNVKKVIIRTEISEDEATADDIDIEINGNELVIIRNGVEEVIEMDRISNKIIQSEVEKDGKVRKHIIVLDKEEIDDIDEKSAYQNAPFRFKVLPNPNDGTFTLEYDLGELEQAQMVILDINGKKIMEDQLNGKGLQKKQINIQQYGSGIYFINLEQANEVLSKKIIVE